MYAVHTQAPEKAVSTASPSKTPSAIDKEGGGGFNCRSNDRGGIVVGVGVGVWIVGFGYGGCLVVGNGIYGGMPRYL